MTDQPSVSFSINDGKNFYADEISITNNPLRFIVDFKCTAPRIDARVEQQGIPVVVEHNAVIMDAFLAKNFYQILGEHLKKYEERFGEIKEPEQLKKVRDEQHEISSAGPSKPGYFG
jgi:hypothetical protein